MGSVEAVTEIASAPLVDGALAGALDAGRARFNARVALARRLTPGFDAARFGRHFVATARPVVDAVAASAPDRVQAVTEALFDIAIDLAGRGSRGPAAASATDLAWIRVLPA